MAGWKWIGGAAIALSASLAFAQSAPESLLPPGFDDPAPTPTPTPTPRSSPSQAPGLSIPGSAQSIGGALPATDLGPMPDLSQFDFTSIPTVEQLEEMTPEELDALLGLRPSYDIPPAARRAMTRVGVVAANEGGQPEKSLARQPASLVRAVLAGLDRPVVSRWGHILLRRSLASRMQTPAGMSPVEFAGLRAKALNAIGEYAIARALIQDIDTGNWDDGIIDAGLESYIATTDLMGTCPLVRLRGNARDDAQWQMLRAICNSYAGEGVLAGSQLDRALRSELAPRIDVLLAQRLAGAAGRGRRAVDVEWDGVEEINPWRFAIANAVGEDIPEGLLADPAPYYERIWASTTTLGLPQRALGADRAAREGIFSARAMVDLYGQIYAEDSLSGEAADRATQLREAYVAADPGERIDAMQEIWGGARASDYGRYVLTAYAAARIPANSELSGEAPMLLASMLTAGLDRDADAWSAAVEPGSEAWALVALSRPGRAVAASSEAIDSFVDNDGSDDQRHSRLLLAGLAGLGRISGDDLSDFTQRIGLDLSRQTRWSRTIKRAADVDNQALVALLAGLGMQGDSWEKMTPLHLFHIVSALRRTGFEAEARMIAAEAIARG